METDVAAPGVPESEQVPTVFIKPPPFLTLGDGAPRSEKPKTHLAAAKAQDLFGIFYSSTGLSGPFSLTRPAKGDRRDDGKSQAQNPVLPAPQPPPAVQQPDPDGSEEPQTRTESDIRIASVWSLHPNRGSEPEAVQSETHTAEPVQPEDVSLPNISPNQILNPDFPITQHLPSEQDTTQTELEPQPGREDQPEKGSDTTPDSEPKPGNKARGKANSRKRTSPASRPVHQTRSQTRYQTRQQRQNQSEQDLSSGDSGSAASDSKEPDTPDPALGSQPEGATVQEVEITPESLGLPSDIACLDFESDFNFE